MFIMTVDPDPDKTYCAVYWGSHGCELERGHDGKCECDCCECFNHPDWDSGCVGKYPYYGPSTNFYGDDATEERIKINNSAQQ